MAWHTLVHLVRAMPKRSRPLRKLAAKRPIAKPRTTRTLRRALPRSVGISVPEPWKLDRGGKSISVQVKTKDFLEAVDLIQEIAQVAEELEHHPDLHLERWNHLRVTTYSHDVGKLTSRDERLAGRLSALLAKRGLP